jgi:hypothetical protein
MFGVARELLVIAAVITAIVALARWSGPGEIHLATGKNCIEVLHRLDARDDQSLSPAERIDLADCSGP